MKTFTFSLLFAMFFLNLHAQLISVTPEYSQSIFEDVVLTDYNDFPIQLSITNHSPNDIALKWVRELPEDCPMSWQAIICDINACYAPHIVTNYDPNLGINQPVIIEAKQTSEDFYFHVWLNPSDNPQPGCCTPKMYFYEVKNPDSLLAVSEMEVSINKPNCFTNTNELAPIDLIKIYPNPAKDFFRITENSLVKEIEVFNIQGQAIRTFQIANDRNYDIGDLGEGIYLLKMLDKEGNLLKTEKLYKNNN